MITFFIDTLFMLFYDVIFLETGRLLVSIMSFGQWRAASTTNNEKSSPNALSYMTHGQRVVTRSGMTLLGFLFYLALFIAFIVYCFLAT